MNLAAVRRQTVFIKKKRKQYFGETEGREVKKLKQENEYREK